MTEHDEELVGAALRALARADREMEASAGMEARLLEAMPPRVARERAGLVRWLGVAAAFSIVVGGSVGWLAWERAKGTFEPPAVAAGFVPWPGAVVLPPFESGELVRTELPVTVLPLLGLADGQASPDGFVKADLLIGQDGMVRAVRLAPIQGTQP
jgi:hypothetical protein